MFWAYAMLLFATLLWGASFVVIKHTVAEFPPLSFLGWRFLLAALCLLPWRLGQTQPPGSWRGGLIMGVWLGLGYLGQTFGLRFTSASNSGFLTGLYIVFTPLCIWLVGRGRPNRGTVVSAVLGIAGLMLLTGAAPAQATRGDLLTLAAALAFSGHFVAGERYAPHCSVAALNFVQFSVVALACLALGLLLEGLPTPQNYHLEAILFTSLGCTVVGFGAQTYAQARLPATTVALAIVLEAPIAAIFGHIIDHDSLHSRGCLGALLIVAACAVSGFSFAKRAAQDNMAAP